MKNIPRDSKILSISHNDLDGATAQIVLGQIFKNITYLNTSFYRMNSVLESVDYDKYDFVFITDINPADPEKLNLSDKIILIDHHESAIEANDPSKMHYVISNRCAASTTKLFVEKYYDIKLSHLDNLVRLTNIYDMWDRENGEFYYAKKLNDVMFFLYRPKKFREQFFDGRTEFTQKELDWLEMREVKFKDLYENLTVFDLENINGCVVQSREFINEICDKLMREEGYDIVFVRNPSHGRVSIRHKRDDLHIGNILKEKGWGGGHLASAGMFCEDIQDFQNKIEVLEKLIAEKLS